MPRIRAKMEEHVKGSEAISIASVGLVSPAGIAKTVSSRCLLKYLEIFR